MIVYGAKELANGIRTVRKGTVQVARDIPEDNYDFEAAPGLRTVRSLLSHIAWSPALYYDVHRDRHIATFQGYDFGALMAHAHAFETAPRSKAELIALLESDGEAFAAWVEGLSADFLNETFTDGMGQNPKTRFENLLGAKEHEMHHRAQLMVLERMVGVVPHLTRDRQERAAARAAAAAKA